MIIKEISVKDFRSFYGDHSIELSPGLTLFIGDNGDGKTTLFELIEWLFDTTNESDSKYENKSRISARRIAELDIGESDYVKVSMKFEHYGEKEIEKSFTYRKIDENNIEITNNQYKGWEIEGEGRHITNGATLLNRCFDYSIRQYSMFKGENTLDVFESENALNYLVETFSEVRNFDPYFTGDGKGFLEFAVDRSDRALKSELRKSKRNEKELNKLEENRRLYQSEHANIDRLLSDHVREEAYYTERIDELESSKELSEQIIAVNNKIKELEDELTRKETDINERYSIKLLDDYWILVDFLPILDEYEKKISEFSKEKRRQNSEHDSQKGAARERLKMGREMLQGEMLLPFDVPNQYIMQDMLKKEFCAVCGRDAKKGSDAYKFMSNKLKKLQDDINTLEEEEEEESPLFQFNYLREFERIEAGKRFDKKHINGIHNSILDYIELNETRKNNISDIKDRINSEVENKKHILSRSGSLSELDLENNYNNLSAWYKKQAEEGKKVVRYKIEEKRYAEKLDNINKEIHKLSKEDPVSKQYSLINTTFELLYKAFKYAKERNTNEFLQKLKDVSNFYLQKLNIEGFHGIIDVYKLGDTARIELKDSNGIIVQNENEALRTTKYMSVLFAIAELTTLKRESDYPLIFDAPTSSFGEKKEKDFFEIISQINKQCIIFTKSFIDENGKLKEEYIDALDCSVYKLEKEKEGFDPKDITTIRTYPKLIK